MATFSVPVGLYDRFRTDLDAGPESAGFFLVFANGGGPDPGSSTAEIISLNESFDQWKKSKLQDDLGWTDGTEFLYCPVYAPKHGTQYLDNEDCDDVNYNVWRTTLQFLDANL